MNIVIEIDITTKINYITILHVLFQAISLVIVMKKYS